MIVREQGNGLISMLKDPEIGLKTKGLLTYLSRCPEHIHVTCEYIAQDTRDGVAAIQAAANEAERHGYLKREQQRIKTKTGSKFGEYVWTVRI